MYLVINLGLKSIRGIVFDHRGVPLYSKNHPVHTTLSHDKVEQDAAEWKVLLEKILEDLRDNTDLSNKIRYVTVTTSSSCIVGVDEKCHPLTKVMLVSDKRSEHQASFIKQTQQFQKYGDTGLTCSSSSLVPKVLWFKDNEPDVYTNVRYWLGAGEIFNYFFTGKYITDPLNAGKAFYSGGEYLVDLIREVGISETVLPEVLQIGSFHTICSEVLHKYKLHPDSQFILTTYDAICAVLGSSNGDTDNACDVSGTVTSVRVLHDQSVTKKSKLLLVQSLDHLKKYLIGASNNLGGGIIEWYKQAFFDTTDQEAYYEMDNQAQECNPGAGGILFLPYLLGERAPFHQPNATASFFGINRNTTQKEFTRSVFESTAYATRGLLELIMESGIKIKSITVSGGLSRFDIINQIKADVCNVPVNVVENFESTSLGAFMLMTMANNVFPTVEGALREFVKIRKVILPSPKNHILYEEYYSMYKELNTIMTPFYDRHRKVKELEGSHKNQIVRNL